MQQVVKDAAVAGVAGYVGTKVMEPVVSQLYERQREEDRKREDEVRPGPPYQIAAERTLRLLGDGEPGEKAAERLGLAFHYGLAVSWVPVYMLMRRRARMSPAVAGLGMGAAMWAIADELLTPALGFSAPNRAYPLVTHARALVGHLVFGVAVAAVTEAGWRLLRRD
jgi:hypothetical protein